MDLFGISHQSLLSQLLLGLVNGAFYAVLSLGLSIIFGLLNIVNFAHGALYMLGALGAWMALEYADLGYWTALLLVPPCVGVLAALVEMCLLRRLYRLDPIYGMLLTFGLALVVEGVLRELFGVSGKAYPVPEPLAGSSDIGFMVLPDYRAWVVAAALLTCFGTWYLIERTRLGSYLRAGTESPGLVQAFGINVPMLVTITYAFGATLAAFGGVLAAPIVQVQPLMGANLIITVFAVVVIGGMGSILGSVVTGLGLGVIEGMFRLLYPEASGTVIFLVMILVLMVRPAGLFGKTTGGPR